MLKPEETKAKIILKKTTQAIMAEKIGITRSQLSAVIISGSKVAIKLIEVLGVNPFQNLNRKGGKPKFPLNPREIRAQLLLKQTTQTDISRETNISRSQVSSIIKHGQEAIVQMMNDIGENPLQMTEKELKKHSKKHSKKSRKN